MARDNLVVTYISKASDGSKLLLNVFLVLEDVGLTRKHGATGRIIGRNVDNSKSRSVPEKTTDLSENAVTTKEGNFVKSIPAMIV